jgi:hypothetical protein
MITFLPEDPSLAGMFRLDVHESVFEQLVEEGAIVDGYLDPEHLETWAERCDNPDGQRATMARAIAQLRRLGPLAVASTG